MTAWIFQAAQSCWLLLAEMAPYMVLGMAVAGALHVWLPAGLVERHLGGGNRLLPPLKAALWGIPLPLCSCGVIPLAAELRRQGAGPGATASFLIATPQTGADSILATYSLMGPVYAVMRPLAALASGLLGGWLAGGEKSPAPAAPAAPAGPGPQPMPLAAAPGPLLDAPPLASCGCDGSCCAAPDPAASRLSQAWGYALGELPADLARPFLLGVAGAGVLAALLPPDFFATLPGGGLAAMLLMLVVGAPLYVCATAAVPLAAAMLAKGLDPGAALVFLIAAPATNLATMATVGRVLGGRVLTAYLGAVLSVALAAGLVTGWALGPQVLASAPVLSPETPSLWEHLAAALLLAAMVRGWWVSRRT